MCRLSLSTSDPQQPRCRRTGRHCRGALLISKSSVPSRTEWSSISTWYQRPRRCAACQRWAGHCLIIFVTLPSSNGPCMLLRRSRSAGAADRWRFLPSPNHSPIAGSRPSSRGSRRSRFAGATAPALALKKRLPSYSCEEGLLSLSLYGLANEAFSLPFEVMADRVNAINSLNS